MMRASRSLRDMPWWLWPDVLCLVGPLAAVAWQVLFAQVSNVQLPLAAYQALFLTVWIAGFADRLTEARYHKESWRHWAAWRLRVPIVLLLLVALAAVTWIVLWFLPQVIMEMGVFLMIPLFFYVFLARVEVGPRAAVPRELVRGALFSAGVLLPTYAMASVPTAALQLMMAQTLLVSLVFLGITCQERLHWDEESSRADWLAIDVRIVIWMLFLLGTAIWLAMEAQRNTNAMVIYYSAMVASGIAFLLAYIKRDKINPDGLHGLAWAALTIPLLFLLFLQLHDKQQTAFTPGRPLDEHRTVRLEDGIRLNDRLVLTPKL